MLTISRDQMEVFEQLAIQQFENEMVVHCRGFSPRLCETLDEDQLRKVIRASINRADGYGFTFRGPVRLYLDLVLLFGSHFDADPQYQWAKEILLDLDAGVQMFRAKCLHEKLLDYLQKVHGENDTHVIAALERTAAISQRVPTMPQQDIDASINKALAWAFPEKVAYIGQEGMVKLIGEAQKVSRLHDMDYPHGRLLLTTLMFSFGYKCLQDPLYPWMAKTMLDERIETGDARVARLEKKSLTWLNAVLAWQKGGKA